MADFRIDRIRFKWRGDWSAGTLYVKDDVLRFGAKVYVCIEVHTSDSNFYNDLNSTTPKWTQMMDGQSWTGDWKAATFYKIGELVKVGGLIYKCIEGHISNADANNGVLGDELKWVYFARGENWTSVWTPETLYNVDDTVIYGGTVYKCLTSHQSQNADAGLEFDAEKWEFYSQSDNFRGEWQPNTHYYIDDIARYGGILYRAIGSHISTPNIVYTNPTNTYNQDNVNNPTGGTNATFEVYRDGGNYYGKILTAGSGYIQAETFTVLGSNLNGADSTNDCTITITTVDGTGAIIGNPHGAGGAYPDHSQPGNMLEDPTHPGILLSYAEVCFHLADAANRGWNVGGDAATHYANGVSASILQWGGDQAAADAYLLESDVAWDASMANQRIGTQKWIAMFDQGIEAWCTWKMYDHPTMNTAAAAGTTPPTRYNYSVDETQTNGPNVSAANGGVADDVFNKVFWDVN